VLSLGEVEGGAIATYESGSGLIHQTVDDVGDDQILRRDRLVEEESKFRPGAVPSELKRYLPMLIFQLVLLSRAQCHESQGKPTLSYAKVILLPLPRTSRIRREDGGAG